MPKTKKQQTDAYIEAKDAKTPYKKTVHKIKGLTGDELKPKKRKTKTASGDPLSGSMKKAKFSEKKPGKQTPNKLFKPISSTQEFIIAIHHYENNRLIQAFNQCSEAERFTFAHACYYQEIETIPLLRAIEYGMDPEFIRLLAAYTPKEYLSRVDPEGNTIWHLFFTDKVKTNLKKEKQIHNMAFFIAKANDERKEPIKSLPPLTQGNRTGSSPLKMAMIRGHDETALLLLNAMIENHELSAADIQPYFEMACASSTLKPRCIEKLLQLGAKSNTISSHTFDNLIKLYTPHTGSAGFSGKDLTRILDLLIDHGARIEIPESYLMTLGKVAAKEIILGKIAKNLPEDAWNNFLNYLSSIQDTPEYNSSTIPSVNWNAIRIVLNVNPMRAICPSQWDTIMGRVITYNHPLVVDLVKRGVLINRTIDFQTRVSHLDRIAFYCTDSGIMESLTTPLPENSNLFGRRPAHYAASASAYYHLPKERKSQPQVFSKMFSHLDIDAADIIGYTPAEYALMCPDSKNRSEMAMSVLQALPKFCLALEEALKSCQVSLGNPLIGIIAEYLNYWVAPQTKEALLPYNHFTDEASNQLIIEWAMAFIKKADDEFKETILQRMSQKLARLQDADGNLPPTPENIAEARKMLDVFNHLTLSRADMLATGYGTRRFDPIRRVYFYDASEINELYEKLIEILVNKKAMANPTPNSNFNLFSRVDFDFYSNMRLNQDLADNSSQKPPASQALSLDDNQEFAPASPVRAIAPQMEDKNSSALARYSVFSVKPKPKKQVRFAMDVEKRKTDFIKQLRELSFGGGMRKSDLRIAIMHHIAQLECCTSNKAIDTLLQKMKADKTLQEIVDKYRMKGVMDKLINNQRFEQEINASMNI